MKFKIIILITFLFTISSPMAQNTPATKDDIKMILREIDKRFEQVDKQFEQTREDNHILREDMNKRFEQVDKRFDDMYQMFMFAFGLLASLTLGSFAFLYNQNRKPLDEKQIISVLANANNESKQRIRQLLQA